MSEDLPHAPSSSQLIGPVGSSTRLPHDVHLPASLSMTTLPAESGWPAAESQLVVS